MTEKILITGATGTVGTAAAKYLKKEDYKVIGVSRSIEQDSEKFTATYQINLLKEEDLKRLENILRKEEIDTVFHLAWNLSEENFDTSSKWEGNMQMFRNILEVCKELNLDTFINGSSIHAGTGNISAYTAEGRLDKTPEPYRSSIDPEDEYDMRKQDPNKLLDPRADSPDSPYGESKIKTEKETREAVKAGGINTGVSIRIGGVNPEDQKNLEAEPYYSSLYFSHKDLGRTVKHIMDSQETSNGYYQMYGVSDNKGRVFNIENPFIGGK